MQHNFCLRVFSVSEAMHAFSHWSNYDGGGGGGGVPTGFQLISIGNHMLLSTIIN